MKLLQTYKLIWHNLTILLANYNFNLDIIGFEANMTSFVISHCPRFEDMFKFIKLGR